MNPQDILRALQAGEVSLEEAKKELMRMRTAGVRPPEPRASGMFPRVRPTELSQPSVSRGSSHETRRGEAIAIIGMSGRYPDAGDLGRYWDNLVDARNSIREIPRSRWDVDRYYDPDPSQKGKVYCRRIGLLDDIEYFDPFFFDISPSEAERMDPQHRIFLQEAYKAFEDAGYSRRSLSDRKCGVYLGIMSNEYGMMLFKNQEGTASTTSNNHAIAAARIPYFLNLKGPAIPIDTACSSSLVATHLACQSLLHGEIDMALVGGVTLYLTPESYISMCSARMLSPDGQCKTLDNNADGFVPGEGAGALVLKRLSDAEADHDNIYGVIIGSGINQNGNSNGITAPHKKSQIELEREIYDKYKIDPETISYVEMHGTGSRLGDAIEVEALTALFKEKTNRKNYCALGSVKSNIGHTSAASGVASVQKVLLCLEHKKLVPTLNVKKPNELIPFEDSPFYVNTGLRSWEAAGELPRRACVSSFGFSGTNAHVVIEEYQPRVDAVKTPVLVNADDPILFVLSAKTEEQLRTYAESIKSFIGSHEEINLRDMAYTLQAGREAMEYRLAYIADSRESLQRALQGFIENNGSTEVLSARADETGQKADIPQAGAQGLKELAELWVAGKSIDWNRLYGNALPRRISLPTYPFIRERYWIGEMGSSIEEVASVPDLRDQHSLASEVYRYDEPYLKDHTVNGEQVLIGVTHASLAIDGYFKMFPGEESVNLHRLSFIKPIQVKKDQQVEVKIDTTQKGSAIGFSARYRYDKSGRWEPTATGSLRKADLEEKKIDIERLKDSFKEYPELDRIYTNNPAVALGESFKTITHLYAGTDQVLARVALQQASQEEDHHYVLHPLIINSAFVAGAPLLEQSEREDSFLAFGINDIYFRKTDGLESCWVLVRLVKNSGEAVIFDADLITDESKIIARLTGCSLKRLRSHKPVAETGGARDRIAEARTSGDETENFLTRKIQQYLTSKLKKIIPYAARLSSGAVNLMDLGVESTQLVTLANQIEREAKIELNPTVFFEYPNIRQLTEYLSQKHRDAFTHLLGTGSKQPLESDAVNQTSQTVTPKEEMLQPVDIVLQTPAPATHPTAGPIRDDIAVIGMHGIFAESSDLGRFWNNLRDKKDLIREIPPDHWDHRPWYDPNPEAKDKTYCKWGSFIDGVDRFDAEFFSISPREADWMDPQLRLLLQSIYATTEDAGYINRLRGTDTGVFIGVCCHDYLDRIAELNLPIDPYSGTGNAQTVIANRVSFIFDLTGPSIAIDTACSSSLFALHSACHALRNRECGMAFVGGVNLLLSSQHYRYFSSIGALSPTGRCHTFDAAADGYVPGEGIASMLLKPLQQAKNDGDC